MISQTNVNVVIGGPAIDMLNPRPGTTLEKVTACVEPRFVVIVPETPFAMGSLIAVVRIPEFERLQLFGSDQRLHTRSAEALVIRETPYVFIGWGF